MHFLLWKGQAGARSFVGINIIFLSLLQKCKIKYLNANYKVDINQKLEMIISHFYVVKIIQTIYSNIA